MPKTVRIDLMTRDKTLKANARAIASEEATGVKSMSYVGEGETVLVVTAETIDAVTVVDKIRRKANLPNARLLGVE
ncbi:hypothetical protein NL676_007696 [Syzygium grande]|nr:hypothetical protein NL676_007696 [Syzygium grande]